MTKQSKIFTGIALFSLFVIYTYFYVLRNDKTGVEKSIIKTKIAKSTREPILGKEPMREFKSKIFNGKIPFVNNKQIAHKYDKNETSSGELVVKWKDASDLDPIFIEESVKKISEKYADFIEKYADARYFKVDFPELLKIFEKKKGDKVTLVIDGEEFEGYIDSVEIEKPDGKYYADGSHKCFYYNVYIRSNEYFSDSIDIGGYYDPITKEFAFEGDIDFRRTHGGIKYRFDVTQDIGVILPYAKFDYYIYHDLGIHYQ